MPEFISHNISVINFILINMSLGISIYLTLYTGMLSLANAGFMAIGAYTAALLITRADIPLGFTIAPAMFLAVLVALPLGLLVLRLRDVYLAIATLGFGEIIRIIALNGDKVVRLFSEDKEIVVFNGAEGITLSYVTPKMILGIPDTTWPLLIYLAGVTYLAFTIQNSRYGRVLASIRQDETAAHTLGIDVVRYKLLAFVLSAAIAAGAGALSTPVMRVIDPRNYVFGKAVDILAFAVLGGMTHWMGAIVGATVLTSLPEVLSFLKDQRDIANGLIIMISTIYLPRGLVDPHMWRASAKFFQKKFSGSSP